MKVSSRLNHSRENNFPMESHHSNNSSSSSYINNSMRTSQKLSNSLNNNNTSNQNGGTTSQMLSVPSQSSGIQNGSGVNNNNNNNSSNSNNNNNNNNNNNLGKKLLYTINEAPSMLIDTDIEHEDGEFDKSNILKLVNEDYEIFCRVHTSKPLKYICLDQFCDYQRMICQECEQTEHFKRHQHRCILLSEIQDHAEERLKIANWPQDSYLKTFQDYLKGQQFNYETRIRDICEKMIVFLEGKIEEVKQTLIRISSAEQERNSEKNSELQKTYQQSCSNFDKLRKILAETAKQQSKIAEDKWKPLQVDKEKRITLILKEYTTKGQEFKQFLNQTYGFGYFDNIDVQSSSPASSSIIDFPLVQAEFTNIQKHVTEAITYIQKNAYLPEQQKQQRNSKSGRDIETMSENNSMKNINLEERATMQHEEFSPGLRLATQDMEKDYVAFRPDQKTIFVSNFDQGKSSTYFYSNILPQQSIFQLRVTGQIDCGLLFGVIDDDSKSILVNKKEKQSHFVGACLGCPNEVYGMCKTQGTGLRFNESEYEDDHDGYESGIQSVIVEVFINLTKKMITIADIAKKNYIKFDLGNDKQYFYNRNLRLFVQSNQQVEIQVLQYNWVR